MSNALSRHRPSPPYAMFKRRDWVHLKGKDGRGGDSSSDDESDEEQPQQQQEEPEDELHEAEESDEGEEDASGAARSRYNRGTQHGPSAEGDHSAAVTEHQSQAMFG